MAEEDYESIGFRAGLEIHQQLETSRKLFCRCPAPKQPYDNNYHSEIVRTMRPTPGEQGEVDPSILMEYKSKKEIHYRINRNTICTYDLDQTPPFEINEEALDIAFQLCYIFNAKIVDELFVIRKHQLDGGIPSGFQRTVLVGVDGSIEFKNRQIRISQIILEEDTARKFSDVYHTRTFFTDRLGIPLVEIVTEPDLKTPLEVMEFCELLRNYLLAFGRVRLGSGTFRFDLNLSIAEGARIEIKAIDKIKKIPKVVYNEISRQLNLLRLREELHRRGISPETFTFKTYNLYKVLKNTSFFPIARTIHQGGEVHCVVLPNWAGLLKWNTQQYTFFAQEISDRVRVIACLTDLPNIVASDIIDNTISREEIERTTKFIGASEVDAFVIVWGKSEDIKPAIDEIANRAYEATMGVPRETRRALPDGTTVFERYLPGTNRMYPDTDLPSIILDPNRLERIRHTKPEDFRSRVFWCKENKIPQEFIIKLSTTRLYNLVKELSFDLALEPTFVAIEIFNSFRWLERRHYNVNLLSYEQVKEVFRFYKEGKILKEGIKYAFELILKGMERYILTFLAPASQDEILNAFNRAKVSIKTTLIYNPSKIKEIATGLVMQQLRGRVDGSAIKKFVDQHWVKANE
ncbi:MAG: Glu-tRNA(Gln) amidotransferase subunit GatE [Candidatus Kapaibacteriota bacterium]